MRVLSLESRPFHSIPYIVGTAWEAILPFHRAIVDCLPDGLEAIVATGDLQGVVRAKLHAQSEKFLGEVAANELALLQDRRVLPRKDETAVLLTGDLQPSAGISDVSQIWQAMADVSRWVAGVAGNHDDFGETVATSDIGACLGRPNVHFLDGQVIEAGHLRIGGLGGVIGDRAEPWQRSMRDYVSSIRRLIADKAEVILLHDGPNVLGTEFAGWPAVRLALESSPPTLVFRGHDRWPARLAMLGNGTQVVNVESCVLVLTCQDGFRTPKQRGADGSRKTPRGRGG